MGGRIVWRKIPNRGQRTSRYSSPLRLHLVVGKNGWIDEWIDGWTVDRERAAARDGPLA